MAIPTRVGILVPSTNTAAEADFRRAVSPAITIHSHRLWLETANSHSEGAMDGMNSQLEDGARHLAAGKMNVVAMVGTTNSFYKGKSWSDEMEEILSRGAGGLPAVTSSPSIAQALRHYGVKKLSVATPYPQWNNDRLKEYFEEAGFKVLNVDGEPWAAAAGPKESMTKTRKTSSSSALRCVIRPLMRFFARARPGGRWKWRTSWRTTWASRSSPRIRQPSGGSCENWQSTTRCAVAEDSSRRCRPSRTSESRPR